MRPEISIIVCTYNAPDLVARCLNSILNQTYKNIEILCVDGMSIDKTRDVVKKYMKRDKRVKLILNKNRLPEGKGNGKWLGFKRAKGKIIGVVDQDNLLQREDLIEKVLEIFKKNKDLIGILGGLKHDLSDERIVRYVSLVGTDSFFAYRSVDFIRNIRKLKSHSNIEIFPMQVDNMTMTGGNCFFYKKSDLEKIEGYEKDIVTVRKLIKSGKSKLMIIPNATKHYAENNLLTLTKKKFFWGKKFQFNNEGEFSYLPSTAKERVAFIKNILFNLTIIPNFYYSSKLFSESKDFISFTFPIFAFLNTLAYGVNFLKTKF
ncbi:MAG: glycosyltransferase family 2 protein [Nanoarchaeota archaeon]|nr:glycosyltransferase family 2 protein [Nanoarchaeota archaeon]